MDLCNVHLRFIRNNIKYISKGLLDTTFMQQAAYFVIPERWVSNTPNQRSVVHVSTTKTSHIFPFHQITGKAFVLVFADKFRRPRFYYLCFKKNGNFIYHANVSRNYLDLISCCTATKCLFFTLRVVLKKHVNQLKVT